RPATTLLLGRLPRRFAKPRASAGDRRALRGGPDRRRPSASAAARGHLRRRSDRSTRDARSQCRRRFHCECTPTATRTDAGGKQNPPAHQPPEPRPQTSDPMIIIFASLSWSGVGLRAGVIAGALVIWFWTQSLIGRKTAAK